MREMRTEFLTGNLKGIDYMEDIRVDWRIILKLIVSK
jgi:hypothetical protein